MPELPEVETVVRDLRPLLVGSRFAAIQVGKQALRRPWRLAWNKRVVGATVEGLRRRGKWVLVDLDVGRRLVVHLGMTGQFTVTPATDPVGEHLHFVFELDDGSRQLRYRDPRRFGSVELFADEAAVQKALGEKLGPEPFDLDATFGEAVRGTTRTLKAILLDQTVVAGVGNIYADEALFRAKLHPERRGQSVTDEEVNHLCKAIATVMLEAIERRGSTIRNYVGGSGLRGGYQDEFRVYGKDGEPCPTCRTPIAVVRVAGRSSHYCPSCQGQGAWGKGQEKKPRASPSG